MSDSRTPFFLLYTACFAGFGAVSFQSVFLAVDLFSYGPSGIIGYYLGWFIPSGVLLFPALTWCKKHRPRYLIPIIVASEIAGLFAAANLIGTHPSPILIGIINALVVTGFFQLFHLGLAGVTTDTHRAKELAITKLASQVGGIIGASVGGFTSVQVDLGGPFLISAICFVAATLALAAISPRVRTDDGVMQREDFGVHAEPLISGR